MVVDAGGGGGGSPVGSRSPLIAAAAAKAELMHGAWESTGDWTVKRVINASNQYVVSYAEVEIDTLTGDWTSDATGALSETSVSVMVAEAVAAVEAWRPRIDGLFTRWQDLPSRYSWDPLLDWSVRELSIDPDNPTSTGDTFGEVNTRLAGDIENLKLRVGQLRGAYAQTFAEYYVNQLPATIESQGRLIAALSVASHCQGEIWGRTEDDLGAFETMALEAMKASAPDGPDGDLVLGLTVVAAFATALAAVPTLGGSVALFGAISGGAAIAAGVESAREADTTYQNLPLGADHPDAVFANMERWLDDLDAAIEAQEIGCREFLVQARAFADGGSCELSRPSLNAAPAGEVLSAGQDLVVSADTIARITELWLPSLAADLRQAEGNLRVTASDGFDRATDVGLAHDGAWPEFSSLQQRTAALLTGLSVDLEDAGTKLEEAARVIGMIDDGVSTHYRDVERQVERRNLNDPDDVSVLL